VSYVRVWTHFVWATKYREPVLADAYRDQLFDHIRECAKEKDIFLDRVNGYHDHVHCLVSLSATRTIEKTAQLLKGESSHWFNNKSGFNTNRLEWQDEYFAVAVSESMLGRVRRYIDRQVIHHQKKTFAEEYEELITRYGFSEIWLKPKGTSLIPRPKGRGYIEGPGYAKGRGYDKANC
jgi:putative transposase